MEELELELDPIMMEPADVENLYDFNGYITYEEIKFLGEEQIIARYHDVDGKVIEIGLAIIEVSISNTKVKAYGNLLENLGRGVTKRRVIAEHIREVNNKARYTKKDLFEDADVNYVYGSQVMNLFQIDFNKKQKGD